jgi:glutamate synthase (NADPH/NADH) small chain
MADPRGFLRVSRDKAKERAPQERVLGYQEFVVEPPPAALAAQASRCMDCGIPFCHQGCPLGNLIPEWNDLVYRGRTDLAVQRLYETNNFPEITGRVCPAPCEASCVLNIDGAPVTIKDIERNISHAMMSDGLTPKPALGHTGARVAVVGSGPAGMAAAQELTRMGHSVTVFERDDRLGGLLRYGIPDFKLDKGVLDRRLSQMRAEGTKFETGAGIEDSAAAADLLARFDAVVLAVGARVPRDLPVPGRNLPGVYFAMDYLTQQNRRVAGDTDPAEGAIVAQGKRVVVVGGGDTCSDCVGTALRQGALSVLQLELSAAPPLSRVPENPWPEWPLIMRTSSSQEEGCARDFSVMTKALVGEGRVQGLEAVRAEWRGGRPHEVPASSFQIDADLVFLAMGFLGPVPNVVHAFAAATDARGNVITDTAGHTSVNKLYCAGDASRGQSLVVWAIADGRRVARGVDADLRAQKTNGRLLRVVPG